MEKENYFDIDVVYSGVHSSFAGYERRPVIGITGNFSGTNVTLADSYCRSILKAGGTPLIIPPYDELDQLLTTLEQIDGLLLTGGGDINPLFLGEDPVRELDEICPRRDRQELLLTRLAADRQIPILGICRGIQVMNAAMGGTLYQDIYSQCEGKLMKHSQLLDRSYPSHQVQIEPSSMLHTIFGSDTLAVNSFHHQAVKEVAPGFRITARSADGVIEAIESTEFKAMMGVQWHPECMILVNDERMIPLFAWLIDESAIFAHAKALHRKFIILDSHCDTPMHFDKGVRFDTRDDRVLVDLHKMTEGRLDVSVMVAYLEQQGRSDDELLTATAKADRILGEIRQMVTDNGAHVATAQTVADLVKNKRDGKKSIMLGIENGYAVGKDITHVARFREQGVVYMTLCHNGDNDLCDSCWTKHEHGGLSALGREVVKEMNRVGMVVDLSHGGEQSFYDALACSTLPIVCSHSSCRALCDHRRNLTDDQMRALAAKGGVMQLCLYPSFLREDGKATILDAMVHLRHAIEVMGIDHVGIGSDFDGDGGIIGCASASEMIQLTRYMLKEGYSDDEIEAIWGKNFLRVLTQCQAAANR